MKIPLTLSALCLLSGYTMAAMPVYLPVGSSYTLGGVVNPRALSTSLANPAAPYAMASTSAGKSWRAGFLGPVGVAYEVGKVDDFTDRVDDLEDILGKTDYASIAEANAALDDANSILNDLSESAYVKLSGSTQVPFMPIIYKTRTRGAFMLDASASFVGKANILSDDISVTGSGSNYQLDSNSSLYLASATDVRVGLGYSQMLARTPVGELIGGVKANFHRISLGRSLAVLSDESDDTEEVFIDSISDDKKASSGVGIDLGAIWVSHQYQLGVTLANINQPTFEFDDLGDCSGLSGSSLASCDAANELASDGKLSLSERYKMEAQTTVDGAITSRNRQWILAASYDVNAVKDPVGDDYQWGVVSLAYFSDSVLAPGVRVGYRENFAGSKLSYVTAGLTFFRRLNVDLAYGLEKIEGDSVLPRSMALSVGYDMAF
ncbi:conjugal transfer protein TraF [Marinomonas pollencensis]|uniref:F plasmid transfer operon protein TraF n=1 Tax=Marinomonas pollencensis TaxID=491954 RepID=A0A3E0DJT3_9GAMM|nr:conjugal transfer protein TraF [Marinomonas pollencensis]REG82882.1 F plasmid transfer operon protein TraF [Marinomonas pollencensis]